MYLVFKDMGAACREVRFFFVLSCFYTELVAAGITLNARSTRDINRIPQAKIPQFTAGNIIQHIEGGNYLMLAVNHDCFSLINSDPQRIQEE